MIAVRTIDIRNDFKRVSRLVYAGEPVLVARPRNENLVVITEEEYNKLEKLRARDEFLTMLDESIKEVKQGKTITFTIDELEAMEDMSTKETQAFIRQRRESQKQ